MSPPRSTAPAASVHGGAHATADAQALAEAAAESMWSRDHASQALGMRLERVTPGHAELSMTVRHDMVNGHAICHGGIVFTLADSTFAYACNSYNANTVAQGCAIDYLGPAREGDVLRAVGRERQRTGRTGVYDIEVTNQRGETVALFRGKSYRIDGTVLGTPRK
jgi:acyl-CoA thioesterase